MIYAHAYFNVLLIFLWISGGLWAPVQTTGVVASAGSVPLTKVGASAAIIVTSTADGLVTDGNCTLREAIQAANNDQPVDACPAGSGADTINLPAGLYQLNIEGIAENANQTGDLDIIEDLTLIGAGIEQTILDGGSLDRVIDAPNWEVKVEIRDLTIQHGLLRDVFSDPVDWNDNAPHGAGIRGPGLQGSLIVNRVRFTENIVDQGFDGSAAAIYTQGPAEVHDSQFIRNNAADMGGGIVATRAILIEDSLFENNHGYGTAALWLGDQAAIRSSIFTGNGCGPDSGGVIDVNAPNAQWIQLEITGASFIENECAAETVSINSGNLTIANSLFRDNHQWMSTLQQAGGSLHILDSAFDGDIGNAIVFISGGTAQIERTSITRYYNGSALRVTGGVVQAANMTITSATGGDEFGSGIAVEGGSLRMESVTVANIPNGAPALLVTGGQVIVHNSLIANNGDLAGTRQDCSLVLGTTVSEGFNLISVGDDCGWRPATGDQVGTRAAPLDPHLAPLTLEPANATFTLPVLPGSPAINHADPALCPAVDQRGIPRPHGPRCDIGAYESTAEAGVFGSIYLPAVWR